MKCWWATTILLIGLLAGISSADWVILKVDIEKPIEADPKATTGGAGGKVIPPKGKGGKGGKGRQGHQGRADRQPAKPQRPCNRQPTKIPASRPTTR